MIEVIENLASEALHAEACEICAGKNWYFGNRSSSQHGAPFWKMDLDGIAVFDAVWNAAKARCEQLAGSELRVVRQYANGHTYGLGGQPHLDDHRPGTFTLLYYPMQEWEFEWQGETVFHDDAGEIVRAVMPKPNRAVFFDARIPHAGRAPSRSCPALRVTVAFKLEAGLGEELNLEAEAEAHVDPVTTSELERVGARRVHRIFLGAEHLASSIETHLRELGKTIRLPGFRAGKIPSALLHTRYGARARGEIIGRIATESAEKILAEGGLPESIRLVSGAESGDVEIHLAAKHLSDLPDVAYEQWELERLTASDAAIEEADLSAAEVSGLLEQHLHRQVLDLLDAAYPFTVAEVLVQREFEKIAKAAGDLMADGGPTVDLAELKKVAERRVRLGAIVAELARRHRLPIEKNYPALERQAIDWLISHARVSERAATPADIAALAE